MSLRTSRIEVRRLSGLPAVRPVSCSRAAGQLCTSEGELGGGGEGTHKTQSSSVRHSGDELGQADPHHAALNDGPLDAELLGELRLDGPTEGAGAMRVGTSARTLWVRACPRQVDHGER